MAATVEKISAVTLRVADMRASVRFYQDVLGMELLYGGEMRISPRSARKMKMARSSI